VNIEPAFAKAMAGRASNVTLASRLLVSSNHQLSFVQRLWDLGK